MPPRDLYEWAVKHDVQDCDIEIQYRDGGGYYCGTTDARYGDGIVTQENIDMMNDRFAEPFRVAEEKKKQEELRQKELAELKRLKEKYEL